MAGIFHFLIQTLLLTTVVGEENIRQFKMILTGKADVFPLGYFMSESTLDHTYACAGSCYDDVTCGAFSFQKLSLGGADGTCRLYTSVVEHGQYLTIPLPWRTYEFEAVDCPSGWDRLGDNCYFLDTTFRDWRASRDNCVAMGAVLADIMDASESAFIFGLPAAHGYGDSHMWLGGHDLNTEGVWEWLSGQPMTYTNWNTAEPQGGTNENEMAMYTNGCWIDLYWDNTHFSVCKKSL